jgi:hypothetical protein
MPSLLDLTPPEVTIRFKKGSTLDPIFLYLNENGTVTDLTGYTARMQAREDIEDTAVLTGFDLTTENGGLEIVTIASFTAPAGTVLSNGVVLEVETVYTNPYGVQMHVEASVTAAIDWQSAYFDIELIEPSPSTRVIPLLQGMLESRYEVTR